jgi:BlaI family transcriptional regulator, penicillinase repressor
MRPSLPELSRFELQCLRRLWARKEASVREIQADFAEGPGYSTYRKIFERLEAKGAVVRVRLQGRAWIYRSSVAPSGMIRREIRRLVDGLFDGRSAPLLAHLADMDALTLEDLKEAEEALRIDPGPEGGRVTGKKPRAEARGRRKPPDRTRRV